MASMPKELVECEVDCNSHLFHRVKIIKGYDNVWESYFYEKDKKQENDK